MRIEIPEFTRCCIFFPLRQSLIIWACIRVLLSIGVLVIMSVRWAGIAEAAGKHPYKLLVDHAVWLCFIIIVAIVEIILGLVYIVGCHMKNVKLMKGYYYHCMFIMALIFSLGIYDTVWFIKVLNEVEFPIVDTLMIVIRSFILGISYGALQLYGILLIRSEIKKLITGSDFRFENPAAITEETLSIELPTEDEEEKETKDVEEIIQITSE